MAMDKQTFKICEAVYLGLENYYMGKKDRRKITDENKALASRVIPTLPRAGGKRSTRGTLAEDRKTDGTQMGHYRGARELAALPPEHHKSCKALEPMTPF